MKSRAIIIGVAVVMMFLGISSKHAKGGEMIGPPELYLKRMYERQTQQDKQDKQRRSEEEKARQETKRREIDEKANAERRKQWAIEDKQVSGERQKQEDKAVSYLNHANVCLNKGRYDEAITNYTNALRVKPFSRSA